MSSKPTPPAGQNEPAPKTKATPVEAAASGRAGNRSQPSFVKMAVQAGVQLFHASDGTAYGAVPIGDHSENLRLRNSFFSSWLKRSYYVAAKKTPAISRCRCGRRTGRRRLARLPG